MGVAYYISVALPKTIDKPLTSAPPTHTQIKQANTLVYLWTNWLRGGNKWGPRWLSEDSQGLNSMERQWVGTAKQVSDIK